MTAFLSPLDGLISAGLHSIGALLPKSRSLPTADFARLSPSPDSRPRSNRSAGAVVSLSFSQKPHFNSLLCSSSECHVQRPFGLLESGCVKRCGLGRSLSSFVTSAITTPNSVLSEEAFKKLGTGGFSESEVDASEDEGGEAESVSEDKLALSKLGLPQRFVDFLEKCGITHLFSIQVGVVGHPFPRQVGESSGQPISVVGGSDA